MSKNNQKHIERFFTILMVLFCFTLSGCATNFAHHMALRNVSGLESIYPTLEPPDLNDGRMIIYWEKKPLLATSGQFKINGEAGFLTVGYATQTGAIMDLPQGEYSISIGGVLNKKTINLTIESGKTYCYNTETLFTPIPGPMSGALIPIPLKDCLLNLSEEDIRCCLNNCLVLSVIPAKKSNSKPLKGKHKEVEHRSKDLNISNTKSRIYITRDMYTLGMVKAGLDEEPSFTMEGDTYLCYEVNPGYHTITVSDPNGKRGFKLKTKGGEIYYFHTDTLDYLDSSRGKELICDYDLLKDGFLLEE